MASVFDFHNALGVKERLRGLHRRGEPRFCKDKVKRCQYLLVCEELCRKWGEHSAESGEYLCDFLLLCEREFAVLVVQAHRNQGLNEDRGAGGTLVVYHAGKLGLKLALYGETVASVTHGHDGVHEIAFVAVDLLLEGAVHALVRGFHLAADAGKLGTCVIRDQFLGKNAAL